MGFEIYLLKDFHAYSSGADIEGSTHGNRRYLTVFFFVNIGNEIKPFQPGIASSFFHIVFCFAHEESPFKDIAYQKMAEDPGSKPVDILFYLKLPPDP
jgi:hypothetical protein